MLDKMIFRARIDDSLVPGIVESFHLQRCTVESKVFYESSAYGNFDALFIRIRDGTIQVKCSVHKMWEKQQGGLLDNSKTYRLSQARDMIRSLFDTMGIEYKQVRVTYFEIGLNMRMAGDPLSYIESIDYVGEAEARELFNDANFQKNRQRTTEKSRTKKKVFKIYDKTFEALERRRTADENILRLETVYKRQDIRLDEFLEPFFFNKIANRFWLDWYAATFRRELIADKGIKQSQLEKAREILRYGKDEWLAMSRESYRSGRITRKQWETIRLFARAWPSLKVRFCCPPGQLELEYKEKLLTEFQIGRL